jgi:hypothetical protein
VDTIILLLNDVAAVLCFLLAALVLATAVTHVRGRRRHRARVR